MRVVPISSAMATTQGGGCEEGSGEVPGLNLPLVRREFLKGSGS